MQYKIRLVYTILLSVLCVIVFLGNKNGRASSQGKGNTGAPGDETISINSTTIRTCVNCHNTGPITASIAISVLDSAGLAITQYIPGKVYTARVMITASGPALARYGFQMIALRNSDTTDLDGFSDMNQNNYKIATISNGRTYVEHDNSSVSNIFNVRWTAPVAGTGSVTFYAAGNGVNNNGLDSGDGAAKTTLTLSELTTTSTDGFEILDEPGLQILPNPIAGDAQMALYLPHNGKYQISAVELSTGRLVWQSFEDLPDDNSMVMLPVAGWKAGAYAIVVKGNGGKIMKKAVKL